MLARGVSLASSGAARASIRSVSVRGGRAASSRSWSAAMGVSPLAAGGLRVAAPVPAALRVGGAPRSDLAWRGIMVASPRLQMTLARACSGQAGAQGEKAAGEAGGAAAASARRANEENLPMVAKVGRRAKTTFNWVAVGGIVCVVGGALFYIVRELFPRALSPNAVFNAASDIVRQNPEVTSKLGGEVKTYGTDYGSRREGRRFHIPEYRYKDDDVHFLRVKFNVEGPTGRRGRVYAEVADNRKSSNDYVYLIVQLSSGEIITIHDNRKPIKPRGMRQSDVCMALMQLRAVVYGKDFESSTQTQKAELGSSFGNLKYVRCDLDPQECRDADVERTPQIHLKGKKLEGFQSLEALERTVKELGAKLG